MISRSNLRDTFVFLLVGLIIAIAPHAVRGAAPEGLPLWSPGNLDPTLPFSNRYPAAIIVLSETDARAVVETGIDVENVTRTDDGRWLVRANVSDLERADIERFDREIYKLRNLARETALRDRAWPTWDEYVAQMQAIAAAHPNICRLVSIGQSVQGRDIWFMKISDNPDVQEDEVEFKFSSSLHGDEVTGMDLCIRLINYLTDNYGIDPTATDYINNMEIWICPHSNPDGYVAQTRYNAHGVDLNRTFPDPITDPNDSPAGHEPEVQHFMNLGYPHRFALSANYHGGSLVMNYPWDCQAAYTPDDLLLKNISLGYSYRNPPMWNSTEFVHGVTIGWAWYIIHGGMQDWCYNWRSDFDITIEVSTTKWPSWSLMDQFWIENKDAMLYYMGRANIGIRGIVTDSQSGVPLSATVDVTQIGKTIQTDPDVGDYHRMLEPGTYTLQVTSFGYQAQTIPGIVVVDGPATRRDVQLVRTPGYQLSGIITEQGTGVPLGATVEARRHDNGDLIASAQTNPVTGAYSMSLVGYTYDIRVTSTGHASQTRQVVLSANMVEDFQLANIASVVLVVTDGVTTRIASDLAALGFQAATETPAVTDPSVWPNYKLLVWSAGANADPIGDATKRAALESYVTAGGRLLIEGGQIGYDVFRTPGYPTFGQNVLHSSAWEVSNAGPISIAATTHPLVLTPNTLPTQFTINYVDSGDEDAVRPRAEATLIYKTQLYAADGGVISYDNTPGDPSRGQIVYFAFNYDRLNDTVNAGKLLENSVTWLGAGSSDVEAGEPAASVLAIGPAFPNPAAGQVSFRIFLGRDARVRAAVFDLAGRRVRDLSVSGGVDRVLSWDGRTNAGRTAPSGIYFMRAGERDETVSRRFLWIRD
jgi:hypothetical protein